MDRFVFYSGSANEKPGHGVHEIILSPSSTYATLERMPHWRRALSNFDTSATFEWTGSPRFGVVWSPGTLWRSIEHAFQATKIALADPVAARAFTVNSRTVLGLGSGADAQKKRKMVVLSKNQLAQWDSISSDVMESIAKAKFRVPDSSARAALLATRNAQLWHLQKQRGKPSTLVRFEHLEKIRRDM